MALHIHIIETTFWFHHAFVNGCIHKLSLINILCVRRYNRSYLVLIHCCHNILLFLSMKFITLTFCHFTLKFFEILSFAMFWFEFSCDVRRELRVIRPSFASKNNINQKEALLAITCNFNVLRSENTLMTSAAELCIQTGLKNFFKNFMAEKTNFNRKQRIE